MSLLSANKYTVILGICNKLLAWDSHVFDPRHLEYCSVCASWLEVLPCFPSAFIWRAEFLKWASAPQECRDVTLLLEHMCRASDGYVAFRAEDAGVLQGSWCVLQSRQIELHGYFEEQHGAAEGCRGRAATGLQGFIAVKNLLVDRITVH